MAHSSPKCVTIFGGSGFIGTQVVQELAGKGYRILVAVRRPDLAGHLMTLGTVGQIQSIQANVRNKPSVERAVANADIVINLAGIQFEGGRQRFRAVHAMGAQNVATAAAKAGVKTLVHVSALGADHASASSYARSKALGEDAVTSAFPGATIIRPAMAFGIEDRFFNLFGTIAGMSPVLPVIGGKTLRQPVYVGDIASAVAIAAASGVKAGIYELGGPEVETVRGLLVRLLNETGRTPMLLPVPSGIAKFKAAFLQVLPWKVVSVDQIVQTGIDTVVSDEAKKQKRTLAAFDITPTSMDTILPTYLWRFRKHGQYDNVEA